MEHEVGDLDPIPKALQKKIRDFAENDFIPAALEYLGKIYPKYRKYSAYLVELDGFMLDELPSYDVGVTREQAYDLFKTEDLLQWPNHCIKLDGKRAIGSVIRICKAINKQELAEKIYAMVKNCFIPDEHQDPKDADRADFGLYVKPSKGTVQCDCCPKE